MEEPWRYHTKGNKPDVKEQRLYDSTYTSFLELPNPHPMVRLWGPRGRDVELLFQEDGVSYRERWIIQEMDGA